MLYKDFKDYESLGEEDKVEYLFDAVAYNEAINVGDIAALEEFYKTYHFTWAIYYIILKLDNFLY